MACYVHATRDAAKTCAACGNSICDECTIALADTQICKKCLADAETVPAVQAKDASPFAPLESPNIFNRSFTVNWGGIVVPILLGAVAGAIGGMTYREVHGGVAALIGGLFAAFFAGVLLFCIGALWTTMIVPKDVIRNKGGILGLFGVTDYGKALTIMTCAAILFWVIAMEASR